MPRVKAEEQEEKVPVQFRIGSSLLERIDHAVANSGYSRNAWVTQAVEHLLETGAPAPYRITAEALLANKYTLMVRLDPFVVELIDEVCEDKGMPRTVWMLDACLSKLRRNGVK